MNYSCGQCDKVFTGISPYKDHLNSQKHKKKVGESVNITEMPVQSPKVSLDRYIKPYQAGYKCLLCNVILNSIQQAQSHAVGKSHLKLCGRKTPTYINTVPEHGDAVLPMNEFPNTFTFYGIKIENVTSDIKVFNVDDPISF